MPKIEEDDEIEVNPEDLVEELDRDIRSLSFNKSFISLKDALTPAKLKELREYLEKLEKKLNTIDVIVPEYQIVANYHGRLKQYKISVKETIEGLTAKFAESLNSLMEDESQENYDQVIKNQDLLVQILNVEQGYFLSSEQISNIRNGLENSKIGLKKSKCKIDIKSARKWLGDRIDEIHKEEITKQLATVKQAINIINGRIRYYQIMIDHLALSQDDGAKWEFVVERMGNECIILREGKPIKISLDKLSEPSRKAPQNVTLNEMKDRNSFVDYLLSIYRFNTKFYKGLLKTLEMGIKSNQCENSIEESYHILNFISALIEMVYCDFKEVFDNEQSDYFYFQEISRLLGDFVWAGALTRQDLLELILKFIPEQNILKAVFESQKDNNNSINTKALFDAILQIINLVNPKRGNMDITAEASHKLLEAKQEYDRKAEPTEEILNLPTDEQFDRMWEDIANKLAVRERVDRERKQEADIPNRLKDVKELLSKIDFHGKDATSLRPQNEDSKDTIPANSEHSITHMQGNYSEPQATPTSKMIARVSPVYRPTQFVLNHNSYNKLEKLFDKDKPFSYHDLEVLVNCIAAWGIGGKIREKKGGGSHSQIELPNLSKPEEGMEMGYSNMVKGGVAKKKSLMHYINRILVLDVFTRAGITPDRIKRPNYEKPKDIDLGGNMSVRFV